MSVDKRLVTIVAYVVTAVWVFAVLADIALGSFYELNPLIHGVLTTTIVLLFGLHRTVAESNGSGDR